MTNLTFFETGSSRLSHRTLSRVFYRLTYMFTKLIIFVQHIFMFKFSIKYIPPVRTPWFNRILTILENFSVFFFHFRVPNLPMVRPIVAFLLPDLVYDSEASYAPGPGLMVLIPGLYSFPIEKP